MRCPICKREAVYEGNSFRPFCCERCKMIDLDNWLSGRYRIAEPVHESEEEPAHLQIEDADGSGIE
ncbi:MAG TPA: DNA gyrase inhibitor YacG [Terriglobia bacterium]|nr:DNA gyrase inhibitor YacG [Terriglobia bacterium]